jgi:hypothetical protein
MAVYAGCAIKKRTILKADDLLTFAMWCAATVTGTFAFAGSFKLSKLPGEETNGIYVGIFGLCLVWLSAQKAYEMILELLLKSPQTPTHEPTKSDGSSA